MPEPERRLFAMEAVSTVNELFSDLELEKLQHRHARFLNICMKMTLLGAAVSDSLDRWPGGERRGRPVQLRGHGPCPEGSPLHPDAEEHPQSHGKLESNIVWEYAHSTIPRHLRDVVVTEYGIADLRGKRTRK